MKFTQKEQVYQDSVTGVCYTREFTTDGPFGIAVIDSPGKVSKFGVLLHSYGGHPDVDWDELENMSAPNQKEMFGFYPRQYGSSVLVTEEVFATRFVSLGGMSREVDLDQKVAEYEESQDFSNRAAVARSVTRQLQQLPPALWACQVYTLLKDYLANTPKKPES